MNMDLQTIANHTEPKPTEVLAAETYAETAEELLQQVKAKTPPDITTATEDNLPRIHKAAVAYTLEHAIALELARAAVDNAAERIESAWRNSVHGLTEGFATDFDAAAAALIAEDSRLGNPDPDLVAGQPWNTTYAKLNELTQKLDTLATIRDAYANMSAPINAVSTVYEPLSRICHLPDANTATTITNRCGRTRRGASFWLNLTRFPGVTVKWQTSEQQQTQPAVAHLARHAAALAEQHAQRERAAASR
jgi:hypothetical protein